MAACGIRRSVYIIWVSDVDILSTEITRDSVHLTVTKYCYMNKDVCCSEETTIGEKMEDKKRT